MHIRTRLDELLDELDNVALLRVYELAMAYQLGSQFQTRTSERVQNRSDRLSRYLRAQEALAEVKGELSDMLLAMREDRI